MTRGRNAEKAPEAFSDPAEWVDRHAEAMYRFALLQLRDPDAAEECVQEAFLAAIEGRASFRGGSSERTWLIGILNNKVRDVFRRRARVRTAPPDEVDERVRAMFTDDGTWPAGRPGPTGRLAPGSLPERRELWETLQRCLERLPPHLGDALCLRELHGLNAPEICQVLGISTTNLWVQLHRARARLRECLERTWSGDR